MLELMIRSIVLGALATVAAHFFERGLGNLRMAMRHAWVFALLATGLLPFIPQLSATSSGADLVPQIALPAIVITGGGAGRAAGVDPWLLAWLALSGVIALAYAVSYVRLQRARRTWQPARMADGDVFVSDRFGPAIFGFIRPRIVVPRWIESVSAEEQRLILLHEREHIRARDHVLLLLCMVATVAMPWNPFVWLQTRKLRFTLETDCDQRVLAAVPDRARYATLLVDVGSRQMGLFLTAALAEHRNGLEQRIMMIARTMIRNRWKAAALTVLGIGVTAVACESRYPQEPQPTREAVRMVKSADKVPYTAEGGLPSPNAAELIDKHYPPLLRDAGIGGTVRVRVAIKESGQIGALELVGTSGHPALDEAGLRVAKEMMLPTMVDPQNTIYDYSLVFDPNMRAKQRVPLRALRTEPSGAMKERVPTPALLNREEVSRALVREYPPTLRDAGIGGETLVLVRIDEAGRVYDRKLEVSSGHTALDEAALKVAASFRFEPVKIEGWVPIPVTFAAR